MKIESGTTCSEIILLIGSISQLDLKESSAYLNSLEMSLSFPFYVFENFANKKIEHVHLTAVSTS